MPERFQRRHTVDSCEIVETRRNGQHVGEKKKRHERAHVPRRPDRQIRYDELGRDEIDRGARAKHVRKRRAHASLPSAEVSKKDACAIRRYSPGQNDERAQPPPSLRQSLQNQSQGHADSESKDEGLEGEKQREPERGPEVPVLHDIHVIRKASPLGRIAAEKLDLVETQIKRVSERIGDYQQQED